MCLASTNKGKRGVLLIYKSEDALNWTYFNRLESQKFGDVLECPDLFKVQDKWLLICSPCGNNKDGEGHDNQAVILPVTFNPENGEVSLDGEGRFLDYGFDLYAPQSNLDEDGNRVVMSWVRMECPMKPADNPAAGDKLWNGMMAIPRVVEVRDGEVYMIPHKNIRDYFLSDKCRCETDGKITRHFDDTKCQGDIDGKITRRFDDTKCQLITRIKEGESIDINGYKISLTDGRVVGDRSGLVPEGLNVQRISSTPYIGSETDLEIYYDSDLVEIFAADCKYSISHVTYLNAAK